VSQLKIRNALETRLASFATSKAIPVLWENKSSIPTTSYLKAEIFKSPVRDPSIGANHRRYLGIFRVTYYCTDLNKGMGGVESFMDDLANYFPRGLQLTKDSIVVHIEATPSQTSVGYESNYLYTSVEIYYRCDVITN